MESKKRSDDSALHDWAENWKLLRNLWPSWTPTDEQAKEVWWRSFDKPHGVTGGDRVNQRCLREAIIDANRSARWKEPNFIDIADRYRQGWNREVAEIERLSLRSEADHTKREIENEFEEGLAAVRLWSSDRLANAQEEVGRKIRTFVGKSSDPSSWSRVYLGFLLAADQRLSEMTP